MPLYDITLVLRPLSRVDVAAALKRVGCLLLQKGAEVQKLENFGMDKKLPYWFLKDDKFYDKGSYFVYHFMSSDKFFPEIKDECTRDVDIIRYYIGFGYKDLDKPCTLEEEMQPPALRPSVQALLAKSAKNKQRTKIVYKHVKTHNWFDDYM